MARYKGYDYTQTVMVPVLLNNQLLPGTLEFAIQALVERRIDTSIFGSRYKNDETGCPAYDPKILLKVILFAYARGIIASRKIEQACRENITFMALACGQVPDHSAVAAFVAFLKEEIASLFRDILLVCAEQDLLGGTHFALDGAKSKNIDEAFSRRVHYVVEFPLPDEKLRERLWRGMFPPQVPLSGDVDFPFLARQFSLAGGDIRNVALDAAFLAAQDGQVVTMKQLVSALARQMMKQGKIPSATDFKQYHALIGQDA